VVDQPLVLPAGPATQRGPLRVLHARMLSAAYEGVNVFMFTNTVRFRPR